MPRVEGVSLRNQGPQVLDYLGQLKARRDQHCQPLSTCLRVAADGILGMRTAQKKEFDIRLQVQSIWLAGPQ